MIDISLTPTDELILELSKRYDHMVFVGMKVLEDEPQAGQKCVNKTFKRRYKGNNHTCMGLCMDYALEIREIQIAEEVPMKPEDA